MATAVLSTTAKAKKGKEGGDKKDKKDKDVAMAEADGAGKEKAEGAKPAEGKEKAGGKEKEGGREKADKEAHCQTLHNPARVLPQQEGVLSVLPGSRYEPIVKDTAQPAAGGATKLLRLSGFVLLEDKTPSEPQELLEPAPTGGAAIPADMEEPAPPAPFEYVEEA